MFSYFTENYFKIENSSSLNSSLNCSRNNSSNSITTSSSSLDSLNSLSTSLNSTLNSSPPNSPPTSPINSSTNLEENTNNSMTITSNSNNNINDNILNDKIYKAKKAGKYLKLLLHCQQCSDDCNNPIMCKHAKLLYNHTCKCTLNECPISGCLQTKKLLKHFTLCRWERKNALLGGQQIKECLMCSFIGYDDHFEQSAEQIDQLSFNQVQNQNQNQNNNSNNNNNNNNIHNNNLNINHNNNNDNINNHNINNKNHKLNHIHHPENNEFPIPLPPKRLRAEVNNNQQEESNSMNTTLPSSSLVGRCRSISHAPESFNFTNRSARTASI